MNPSILTQSFPSVYDHFLHGRREGTTPIDLSIGNPHLKPPACYYQAMTNVLREIQETPGNGHGYSVGEDPFGLCQALATDLSVRFDVPFRKADILMTVGATGALDVILKTLIRPTVDVLNPKAPTRRPDEILVIAPYFVEYLNLIQGNGATPVIVPSGTDFGLDIDAIENAITSRTRAILINSPNNPTGVIYSEESLQDLAFVLETKNLERKLPIAVIEDAVYDSILFTDEPTPSMIPHYPHLFRVNSYSKSLGLAGERLGYLAMHPNFAPVNERQQTVEALNLNQRMRVVHAPLLQHRVVARLPLHGLTNVEVYRRNLERLHMTLSVLGFEVQRPQGTFYLWAMLPSQIASEIDFRQLVQEGQNPLLYLPGALFGGKAYSRFVRFSVCVPYEQVERACQRLRELFATSHSDSGSTL